MTRTRIAIAGLGAAAKSIHLPAFRKIDELEVVGGHDPDPKGNFDFPLFDSYEAMLEESKPDILAVVTPPVTHFELTKLGLDHGCHVFCEKPFMPTREEADETCRLAKQAGKWVVVNNQYRFMNIHRKAHECLGGDGFGDLVFASFHQTFHVTETTEEGWRGNDPQRTCKEFGIHVLDLCRYFFGEDPTSIQARMPRLGNAGSPDLLNLIQLEFSGDRVAHITLDRLCRGTHRYLMTRLDGTKGCIESQIGGGIGFSMGVRGGSRKPYFELDIAMGGRARLYNGDKYRKLATDPLDLFAHSTAGLMRAFLDALKADGTPPCHAEDNRKTLMLMLAAYESDKRNEPVEMDYSL